MAPRTGLIELTYESPEGKIPTPAEVEDALKEALLNPDFVKKVANLAAVSGSKTATTRIVAEGK
jgi:hypothetical protein